MRRRASGRLGPAIHSPMQTPSWLVRNNHYINAADRDRGLRPFHGPVTSSMKLIVAAGSLPFHGPLPSTFVSHFSSTNTRVEIHLRHAAPLRVNDCSTTVICVRRLTSARSSTALPFWFFANSADDHGTLVSGMCRATPRGVSLSIQRPLVGWQPL